MKDEEEAVRNQDEEDTAIRPLEADFFLTFRILSTILSLPILCPWIRDPDHVGEREERHGHKTQREKERCSGSYRLAVVCLYFHYFIFSFQQSQARDRKKTDARL